jgi:hypothetical protein
MRISRSLFVALPVSAACCGMDFLQAKRPKRGKAVWAAPLSFGTPFQITSSAQHALQSVADEPTLHEGYANVATTAAFDVDGAAQIASSNCEAHLLTQRRVGNGL